MVIVTDQPASHAGSRMINGHSACIADEPTRGLICGMSPDPPFRLVSPIDQLTGLAVEAHRSFTSATQTHRYISMGEGQLDLNYLLYRQQVERSRAATAATAAARETHEELAKKYEEQIERVSGEGFSIPSNSSEV
jgi:hypothetical protein